MLILRVLARGPLHGYGIAQRIAQLSHDELSVEEGPLTYLTCSAETLRHPPRYVVESLRESVV